MDFTFKPLSLCCNTTLSSSASPWGNEDGMRLYFLVEVAFDPPDAMVSGRELPPPDEVDNYSMRAGETIDLNVFPPLGRANWESKVFNIDEGNLVTICLIGINEGLPYIAGGGGGSGATIGNAFAQGYLAYLNASVPAVGGVVIDQIKDLAVSLNNFPDCTGTAFIYRQQYTGKDLLAELIRSRRHKVLTFTRVQSIRSQPPLGGCSVPDYDVTLEMRLRTPLKIADENTVVRTVEGPRLDFEPTFTFCAQLFGPIEVWTVNFDRSITFRPNFNFKLIDLIWEINGQRIRNNGGTFQIPLQVTKQPGRKSVQETVPVGYSLDLDRNLTVSTEGARGSYSLEVNALLQLQSNEPPFRIYSNSYYVHGQELVGNEAYRQYQECVEAFWRKINSYVFVPQLSPIDPIASPTIRFDEIEMKLKNIVSAVRELSRG